ncbi:GNAT family N-acetyltransferase [Nodularia spumigena CS-588/02]|uniref:GNAT family N-acetyltransferase n=1 Tax=Nodularia spumigena TaxID=70799 RepID=UPI00232FCCE7|nr:GNAT family N-acetyltransferase [Nodularia spumigena]MDB9359182.1 GNAT family N-acetyltransferase [Nodularia spumigena CS-588/02]MDB9363619.1 GNAT family N-acetyltransferase [Nodularia spumigena CS-588/02A10]
MRDRNICLRLAEETDAWVMSAIHIAAIKALPTTFYTRKQLLAWRNYLDKPDAKYILQNMPAEIFWVAVENNMLTGFASFMVDELIALYVHPYYQGKGIGRALVTHFCHEAANQGIDKVITTASLYAEGFYLRLGFTAIKRAPHQLRTGIVVPVTKMSKNLGVAHLKYEHDL